MLVKQYQEVPSPSLRVATYLIDASAHLISFHVICRKMRIASHMQ